jgi:DNA-binding beta-propeller fold protein YncE
MMTAFGDEPVQEVDFLSSLNLTVNGAGPLLVRADSSRNRIILVNTFTSSISLIHGKTHEVTNIPIAQRIPQYLKGSALSIRETTGEIYCIGEKSLHVIDPETGTAYSVLTDRQFEMAAVVESTGDAFLVGREDRRVGWFRKQSRKMRYIPCFDREEKIVNLNATPPPSIRKAVTDALLNRVFIVDGYTSRLYTFNAETGKKVGDRILPVTSGARWHFAGYRSDTHYLYVVIETAERKVVQAAKINTAGTGDHVVELPQLTEGVGINLNPGRDQVIIPYDNHPAVHLVDFSREGALTEVNLPAYGNDASAVDEKEQRLYVASWAYGEIDVIDLVHGKLLRRVRNAGILPHMFSMTLNPNTRELFIPTGATAVNGSHGAAVTVMDLERDFAMSRILTGWAPVDLIALPGTDRFLVFNSENEFAEVTPEGRFSRHSLPVLYPRCLISASKNNLYLAYGPHQSYWPTVYIWAAENGILEIEPRPWTRNGEAVTNYQYFCRRLPRLAHAMVKDTSGTLFLLQNSWGKENQFLSVFEKGIRLFSPQIRMELPETIERETIQRVLVYDSTTHRLYLVKIGETDEEPGKLLILDAAARTCDTVIETGRTPTDLVFNSKSIYVTNFDDNTVTCVDKETHAAQTLPACGKPLRLATLGEDVYVICHRGNTLRKLGDSPASYPIPFQGFPDNLTSVGGRLIVTSHSADKLAVLSFDPEEERFQSLMEKTYPYGETLFDTGNVAFYTRGQFGDGLFQITRIKGDAKNRLWITDFLSGKLFIVDSEG